MYIFVVSYVVGHSWYSGGGCGGSVVLCTLLRPAQVINTGVAWSARKYYYPTNCRVSLFGDGYIHYLFFLTWLCRI